MQLLYYIRISCAGLGLLLSTVCFAERLSEQQSLELGLQLPEYVQLLESRLGRVQGLALTSSKANPELEYSREERDDEVTSSVWLSQSFDLAGSQALKREAAKIHVEEIRARLQTQAALRAYTIRQLFFQTMALQQKHKALNHWVDKFATIEVAMFKREKAGDVSGYDRRRISLEKISLISTRNQLTAGYELLWQKLLGLIGAEEKIFDGVVGVLLPQALPDIDALMASLPQQSRLVELKQRLESTRLLLRAEERARFPGLTLGVGNTSIDEPGGKRSGFMFRVSLPLPLFDRNQGARAEAHASRQEAESEYRISLSQARARVKGLWYKANTLRQNAQQFRGKSVNAANELVKIAETAYAASEIGVLELIDAFQSALDSELTAIELELETRQTRIALDRIFKGVSQ